MPVATARKAASSPLVVRSRSTAMMGATSGRANTSAAEVAHGMRCSRKALYTARPIACVRYNTATSLYGMLALAKSRSRVTTQSSSHFSLRHSQTSTGSPGGALVKTCFSMRPGAVEMTPLDAATMVPAPGRMQRRSVPWERACGWVGWPLDSGQVHMHMHTGGGAAGRRRAVRAERGLMPLERKFCESVTVPQPPMISLNFGKTPGCAPRKE